VRTCVHRNKCTCVLNIDVCTRVIHKIKKRISRRVESTAGPEANSAAADRASVLYVLHCIVRLERRWLVACVSMCHVRDFR